MSTVAATATALTSFQDEVLDSFPVAMQNRVRRILSGLDRLARRDGKGQVFLDEPAMHRYLNHNLQIPAPLANGFVAHLKLVPGAQVRTTAAAAAV